VKVLVVDDEPLARERMLRLLAEALPGAQADEAADGESALEKLQQWQPDLLLLDIRMPGIDGIEVASRAAALPSPPAVVFCTAYDEYAMQALQQHAVAYLMKPVRAEQLEQALAGAGRINRLQLARLREEAGGVRSAVCSHTHRGFESMPVASVRCFIAEQKYVTAVAPDGELLIPDTLKDLEQEFGEGFLRVHRNTLVAVQHIQRLEKADDGLWHVLLQGVEHRPAVSRRLLATVKRRLGLR